MKIEKKDEIKVLFKTIKPGECFSFEGAFYLTTQGRYAVGLEKGYLLYPFPTDLVTPIEAKVVIE